MKRIYNTPTINIINIKTEKIIATSVDVHYDITKDAGASLTNKKDHPIWGGNEYEDQEEGNSPW